MAILLKGLILPIVRVESGRVCAAGLFLNALDKEVKCKLMKFALKGCRIDWTKVQG